MLKLICRALFARVPLQVIEVRAKKRTGGHSLVTALRKTLEGHYPDKSLALGGTFIIQKGKAKIHIMVNFGRDAEHTIDRYWKLHAFIFFPLCLLIAKRVLSLPPQHQWRRQQLAQALWGQRATNLPVSARIQRPCKYSRHTLISKTQMSEWFLAPISGASAKQAPLVMVLFICLLCVQGLDLRVEHTHCFSHHGEGGHYYIDTTPDSVEYLGYFMPAEFIYRIDRPKVTHAVGRDWNINELINHICSAAPLGNLNEFLNRDLCVLKPHRNIFTMKMMTWCFCESLLLNHISFLQKIATFHVIKTMLKAEVLWIVLAVCSLNAGGTGNVHCTH